MADICCSCEEIQSILSDLLEEVKLLSQSSTKVRTKRKPSAYNLFMQECLPKKTGPQTEKFRQCAAEYKERKKRGL